MGFFDGLASLFAPSLPALPSNIATDSRTITAFGQTFTVADEYSAEVVRSLVSELTERPNSAAAQIVLNTLVNKQLPRKGTKELMLAFRRMPHLRNVVSRIAVSVGAVKWRVYSTRGVKKARQYDHHDYRKRLDGVNKAVKREELVEVFDHPAINLMDQFNPEMTGVAGRRLIQTYLDLKGECFLLVERDEKRQPMELWPIPPHWVMRLPEKGYDKYLIQSRQGGQKEVESDDVIYIKEFDPENPYQRGCGIGEALGDELDVDEFAAKHMKSWFANHAIPSMLIGIKGADENETQIARERWTERNRGPMRNNRVHFHNGEMNAVRLDDKFADMQIVSVREFEAQIIRETYNVPPETVGHVDNSNRATAEAAMANLSMLVVQPRLEFLRAELQQKLLPFFEDGDRLIVEYDDPIPQDRTFTLEVARSAPWALSVNEWRSLSESHPLEGGDELHMMPLYSALGPITTPRDPIPKMYGETPMTEQPAEPVDEKQKTFVTRAISDDDIDNVLEAFRPQVLEYATISTQKKIIQEFGQKMQRRIGVGGSFNILNPAVVAHLAQYSSDRIGVINDTTKAEVRASLIAGVTAGEGPGKLTNRIRDVIEDASKTRAKTIAITETGRSANFARLESMVQVGEGVVPGKEWLTERDGRQRNSHDAADGTVVQVSEMFPIIANTDDNGNVVAPATEMLYPGDSDVPGQVIRCRCTVIPNMFEEEKAWTPEEKDMEWRAFDRELAGYEGVVAADFARGFKEQEQEAIRKLLKLR